MLAILGALLAGGLTILAPCVLPLLPVIVGGSLTPASTGSTGTRRLDAGVTRALIVTASLAVSIILFTVLLKASTVLIGVPPEVWKYVSGGLLIILGLISVFPSLWERVSELLDLQSRTSSKLSAARQRSGFLGAAATGAALGPVFTSCSPMYGYVVVTVLPANFAYGTVLLTSYTIGLAATLLVIALAGRRAIAKLGWAADPNGWFRKALGVIFILVGIAVILGWEQAIQTWVIENSPVSPWELDEGFIPE